LELVAVEDTAEVHIEGAPAAVLDMVLPAGDSMAVEVGVREIP
jgi:hypothetical protein